MPKPKHLYIRIDKCVSCGFLVSLARREPYQVTSEHLHSEKAILKRVSAFIKENKNANKEY
jgi:hypothetical protein